MPLNLTYIKTIEKKVEAFYITHPPKKKKKKKYITHQQTLAKIDIFNSISNVSALKPFFLVPVASLRKSSLTNHYSLQSQYAQ